MTRHWLKQYFAVWEDLPNSNIVWFEAGKAWAEGLISGNFWERKARQLVLNLINPVFATGVSFVIDYYRDKLKHHIGPNGIWVAIQMPLPPNVGSVPRAYAKKRDPSNYNTKKNASHPPTPWIPTNWNIC